jgi:hypothetical protein
MAVRRLAARTLRAASIRKPSAPALQMDYKSRLDKTTIHDDCIESATTTL